MTRIHLVRHGQAAAGFGAHKDPGLSALGRRQAEAVADLLAPLGPLPVYSSPLARAFETAQPLAAKWGCEVQLEPRVAEIPSPSDDLEERAAWLGQAMQGTWQALEPAYQQWRDGVAECLRAADEDCVMFSHYVAINAAVGVAQGDERLRIFAPDNCSVTTIEHIDGMLHAVALGRTAETKIN